MPGRRADRCLSSSPEETAAFGRRLAGTLPRGTVLALVGPLGVGKTAFVKGLAAGLGIPPREVTSPTFSLIHEHMGAVALYHADLYRVEDPRQVAELGLEDYAGRGGILALEWADRAGDLLPAGAIPVRFEILGPRRRRITVGRPQPPASVYFTGLLKPPATTRSGTAGRIRSPRSRPGGGNSGPP